MNRGRRIIAQVAVAAALLLAVGGVTRAAPLSGSEALQPGLNVVGIPVDPVAIPDLATLLEALGTEETLSRIERLNRATQEYEHCEFDTAGAPTGAGCSAPVVSGEGWLLYALTASVVGYDVDLTCPTIELLAGLNLVALPCSKQGLTSFQLLVGIGGPDKVSSIQSLDPETGRWLATAYDGGLPGGDEFEIEVGRAYLIAMREAVTLPPPGPMMLAFDPVSGPVGTLVTITGTGFAPWPMDVPQVSLNAQGGGSISAPIASFDNETIVVTIPTGAATGPLTVSADGRSGVTDDPFTVTPSSSFALTAAPASSSVIRGESTAYSLSLESANGFPQLATLEISGLPDGLTASFGPKLIGSGQTSILTLTAPSDQSLETHQLEVTATATVDGLPLADSETLTLTVEDVSTSFIGRTVIDDTLQTSLGGVTITFLGRDGEGNPTGCSGEVVSDSAGNFVFTNLPSACEGPQLIRYNGLTATNTGDYAGVDLLYNFVSGEVTKSPVLVHLPRIDNAETVLVEQDASTDQTFHFATIPNLSVTVYAGTTFTLVDGAQPDPFPLTAIQVPVDRLPDAKPFNPNMLMVFIVAFQPANAEASQPVAVTYPNTIDTAPGVNMVLMTLDPTKGQMVPYGTGTVSANGTTVIPDFDPDRPGHRYGLVHFDWHGQMPPPPPDNPDNPCSGCDCPRAGKPVDLGSGIEVISATDLEINGPRGRIAIERTYRTLSNQPGPFGIGSDHNYGYRLDTNSPLTAAVIRLVMPDGNRFVFTPSSGGAFTNSTVPALRGAVMQVLPDETVDLRWKGGTVFRFVPSTAQLESLLTAITDSNGNVISLTRDPARPAQIAEVIDPVGRKLLLSYDTADRITQVTDPIGRRVRYAYNAFGTLQSVVDPEGGVTEYEYLAADRLHRVRDARGNITENTYDANGRVAQQVQADGGVFEFNYRFANPLIANTPVLGASVTNPLGHTTIYRFNPQGVLTDITDALGQTRIFEREPGTNQLLSISGTATCTSCGEPRGGDQSFTYGDNGNVLTSTDALGNTTTFTYEPSFDRVASVTDAIGHTAILTYDASGNLLTRRDANGNTTTYTYNDQGELTTAVDALGETTAFDYDAFGNLAAITDPLGNRTSFQHDGISRQIAVVDALGGRTTTHYDRMDRVAGTTDANGNTVQTSYDEAGYPVAVTDARANTTAFLYDSMSRLAGHTDSRGGSDARNYDLAGNLIEFTDRRAQTSQFSYDELGRLIQETYQDGSTVSRSYDANGRLVEAVDSEGGTFAFEFDAAGGLLATAGPFGTVNYTHDALRRVSQRQVLGQPAVSYGYDQAGNLTLAASPEASVSLDYDPRNLVSHEARSNAVETDYDYNGVGQVSSIRHRIGAIVLNAQTYVYDVLGNRMKVANDLARPLLTQPETFTYDSQSNQQLQRGNVTYGYDENGNRSFENGPTGTTSYTWDARNRLRQIVTQNGASTSFVYDFDGNLIRKQVTNNGITATEMYVLDNLTNTVQQANTTGTSFSLLTGQSIDTHWAIVRSGGLVDFALGDALNSTVAVTSENGSIVGQASYAPYGESQTTGRMMPWQFTGRVLIDSGLYHYRARYYDATSARFISEDPIGFVGGDNFYRYVGDNPTNFIDPTGNLLKLCWWVRLAGEVALTWICEGQPPPKGSLGDPSPTEISGPRVPGPKPAPKPKPLPPPLVPPTPVAPPLLPPPPVVPLLPPPPTCPTVGLP